MRSYIFDHLFRPSLLFLKLTNPLLPRLLWFLTLFSRLLLPLKLDVYIITTLQKDMKYEIRIYYTSRIDYLNIRVRNVMQKQPDVHPGLYIQSPPFKLRVLDADERNFAVLGPFARIGEIGDTIAQSKPFRVDPICVPRESDSCLLRMGMVSQVKVE